MARAMLLALACATLASGARYVDYSGVKMPQYGGSADYEGPRDVPIAPSDEYRDHSPDAPASLDYKYEEDPSGTTGKSRSQDRDREVEDSEVWQKPEKKEKRPSRLIDDDNLEPLDKYRQEDVLPKFKTGNHFSKRRNRPKLRNSGRDDLRPHKQPLKYVRNRNDDRNIVNEDSFSLREEKNNAFEDSKNEFSYRQSTVRVKARRKPRDRAIKLDDDDMDILDDLSIKDLNKEIGRNIDYPSNDDKKPLRPMERLPSRRVNTDDIDTDPAIKSDKEKLKNYGEYDEYYDMKRVHNIKNKLPNLLRRTTTKTTTLMQTLTALQQRDEILWPNRRLVPMPVSTISTRTTDTTSTTTTPNLVTRQNILRTLSTQTVKEELSLAEKSRLSILRKAQRKESFANGTTTTKKPPVLLQVANKLQTVVIVEPISAAPPIFRAREIAEDTPDRLNQVKRMMRHKLVSNAKNIQELTDNWDDMVCDYVDLSLLENSACITPENFDVIYSMLILLFNLVR